MHCKFGKPVLAVLLVFSALLVSCSSPSSTTTSGTASTATKPSGSLTVAVKLLGGMDPTKIEFNFFQNAVSAMFDSLVEITPNGQSRPGIAERWEISPDGKTHTFYVRKGVKFHNGDGLTGADVKFSIERVLAPGATHTDAPAWRGLIEGVDLKDDYTVALRLKVPQFELIQGFTTLTGSTAVMPKKYIEEKGADVFERNPVGSGPFKFVSYERGSRLVLEANEEHWRAVPKFKTMNLVVIPEEATLVAMLKTGEVDIGMITSDSAAGLKTAGLRIYEHDGASQGLFIVYYDLNNPTKHALGNVKARKALSLGVNRQEIADSLYGGFGRPGVLFYGRPTASYWDSNALKPDPYDPEGAKKLLAEAGYPNGFTTSIFDTNTGNRQINLALSGYWRKIGVNAELEPLDYSEFAKATASKPTDARAWGKIFATTSNSGGVYEFERMSFYHSAKGRGWNIKNPRLDELIDKVPMTTDPAEKKRLQLEASVLAKNEYANVALIDGYTLYAVGKKVGELTPIKGMVVLGTAFETISQPK